jgi:ABC-2 type transport system permease protein
LTYIVEAERALFAGDFVEPSIALGAAVAVLVAVVGLALGTRMMRRAAA